MTSTMDCYWLEQTEAAVPTGDQWLNASEVLRLASLRFEKRRTDWRLGRWTAKQALAKCLNLPTDSKSLRDLELRASSSGAPEVFLFNRKADVELSISHRSGMALAVVSVTQRNVGCDMELVEKRDQSFIADFFTANEQKLVHATPTDQRNVLITLLWSAKESALKALHVGLRLDTTSLEVVLPDIAEHAGSYSRQGDCTVWLPLTLRLIGKHTLQGWWRCANNIVRTIVFSGLRYR